MLKRAVGRARGREEETLKDRPRLEGLRGRWSTWGNKVLIDKRLTTVEAPVDGEILGGSTTGGS